LAQLTSQRFPQGNLLKGDFPLKPGLFLRSLVRDTELPFRGFPQGNNLFWGDFPRETTCFGRFPQETTCLGKIPQVNLFWEDFPRETTCFSETSPGEVLF